MKDNRYPKNWAEIRENVFDRDNYTCQHCGAKDDEIRTSSEGKYYKSKLQVAHLDHDPENWDVSYDRLLCLCQPCHLKNDREHVNELIKSSLSKQRINKCVKDGSMTKPQMKAVINDLTKKVSKLEQQVMERDFKLQEIITALAKGEEMIGKLNEIITIEKLNQYSRYSWRI